MKAIQMTVLICLIFASVVLSAEPSDTTFLPAAGVITKAASVEGLPIEIAHVTFLSDYGRNVSMLKFTVTSKSTTAISDLRFVAFYLDSTGAALGADIFPAGGKIGSGKSLTIKTPISRTFPPGTQIIVSVNHAIGPDGEVFATTKELDAALLAHTPEMALHPATNMADFLGADKKLAPFHTSNPDIYCDYSLCTMCQNMARESCTQGVKSYSCSVQSCTCSYTCK